MPSRDAAELNLQRERNRNGHRTSYKGDERKAQRVKFVELARERLKAHDSHVA